MKLIDCAVHPGTPSIGWCVDILKFSRKSVLSVELERSIYQDLPSILLQIGPTDVFYLSLGVWRYILTVSLWSRHYDY